MKPPTLCQRLCAEGRAEFDEQKLGSLDWCGNESHECECQVKEKEIKSFLDAHTAKVIEAVVGEIKKEKERVICEPCGLENRGITGFKGGIRHSTGCIVLSDLLSTLKEIRANKDSTPMV